MDIKFADKITKLPPYLFAELERLVANKRREGIDVISLSIGDPDLPPPRFIIDALRTEVANLKSHNYSSSKGEPEFRQAVTEWYKKRFNVDLDPETECSALIGSKEGIANITRAFINPKDRVLVPDPAYPVYMNGSTILNEGVPVVMPLLEKNNFKPDLTSIDKKCKMMFLNYPNNPTGTTVDKKFLKRIIEFSQENNIIVCYDNAYSEITFNGYTAPSILEIEGAKDGAIEFNSCSKTFNMTGDRIGFAVGNSKLVEGLAKVKSQIDSGPSVYIQRVAIEALQTYTGKEQPNFLKGINSTYQERKDILIRNLEEMGFQCNNPKATFYVWLNCKGSSMEFASKLLDVGVVVTPGIGFGRYGQNFVRFSITQPKERIEEACDRIQKIII